MDGSQDHENSLGNAMVSQQFLPHFLQFPNVSRERSLGTLQFPLTL
jgi:hypothetical protein